MKTRFFLSYIFCLVTVWAQAQTVTSSCNLTDPIANSYRDDADRLALRHTFRINSTYKDSITLNQQLSDRYLKAFLAVYNATMIPARDTVVTWLNIHTNPDPQLKDFFISADSNLIWMKNLKNNVFPCGQPYLDATFTKYSFQKKGYTGIPMLSWHTVMFDAGFNINTLPLSIKISSNVPEVISCGQGLYAYDGPDMRDSLNSNFIELAYGYRWGDCIIGCMYARYWIFRVYNDCSVQYMGTKGNQLPVWASLSEQSNLFQNVKIYPNPASDKLCLNLPDALKGEIKMEIIDVPGQTLIRQSNDAALQQLDISQLSTGTYYLKLTAPSGTRTLKFIKE